MSFPQDMIAATPQYFTTNGAGENTDVVLSSSVLLVTPTVGTDFISGLIPAQQADGMLCLVWNTDSVKNLLLKQTVASSSGFRILMASGTTTLTLGPLQSVWLIFRQGVGWNVYRPGTFS